MYCTEPNNQFDNNCYWEPCVLKKVGHELYEVLDANKDLKLEKEELKYTSDKGLWYLWGLVYKFPSLAFISTFQKKLLTSYEGEETKKVTQAVISPHSMQDENGISFAPSCESKCFIRDKRCAHEDLFRVELNKVGQYVVFPSVWWNHGYINIYSSDNIFFTVQFIHPTTFSSLRSCFPLLDQTLVVPKAVSGN